MVKLNVDGQWLKDFGNGTTHDEEKAFDFTDDEAEALLALYDGYYTVGNPNSVLADDKPPPFPAGEGMVWVRYDDCWFAASRQALFMGTRNALRALLTSTPEVA